MQKKPTLMCNLFCFIFYFPRLFQVNFSEQNLNSDKTVTHMTHGHDSPGSGISLPPTPDSSDRISTGHGMLEPLSVGSE